MGAETEHDPRVAWLARLRDPDAPDPGGIARDLDWLAGPGRCLVTEDDPRYPRQLAVEPRMPAALFVEGDPEHLSRPQVAIVGSRAATAAGCETAFDFAARLAAEGFAITSGLATGIDAAAHRGALAAGGPTIAVCGTGLDRVYPPSHAGLASQIAASGALVSEFPTGTPPVPHNFPRRNRLMSGLARGVLVVEAAARSGSLITARLAGEQGRDVMAVPGSIHNPLARGCHRLIKDGAALVESVDDVFAALGVSRLETATECASGERDCARNPQRALDSDAEMLLNALGFEPTDLDRLVERTGMSARSALSKLQLLELEGRVEVLAGGRYSRTTARQRR
jgi:DNA processing protein